MQAVNDMSGYNFNFKKIKSFLELLPSSLTMHGCYIDNLLFCRQLPFTSFPEFCVIYCKEDKDTLLTQHNFFNEELAGTKKNILSNHAIKNKSKTIQWEKLRDCDVIEDK